MQAPRPGAQCGHHLPAGFSSIPTRETLQHSEHGPQLRPGTSFGSWERSFIYQTRCRLVPTAAVDRGTKLQKWEAAAQMAATRHGADTGADLTAPDRCAT